MRAGGGRKQRWQRVGNLAALCLGLGLGAAPASAAPKLSVATPQIEIGEQLAGETREVAFSLTNTGTEPLRIEKVTTNCGCTTTRYPEVLQPGESGDLHAKLAAAATWNGLVVKQITVVTNDPEQREIRLQLAAQIRPLFRFTPPNPFAVPYGRGEVIRQVFTVTATDSATRLTRVLGSGSGTEARLLPPEGADGAWKVEVTAHPPEGGGDFSRTILLETTHPRVTTVPLILNGISRDTITVSPKVLYLAGLSADPGSTPPRLLVLSRRIGGFRVLAVETDTPALQAEARATGADTTYFIHVRYVGGWNPGKMAGKITVTTDDAHWSKVEIPYEADVK